MVPGYIHRLGKTSRVNFPCSLSLPKNPIPPVCVRRWRYSWAEQLPVKVGFRTAIFALTQASALTRRRVRVLPAIFSCSGASSSPFDTSSIPFQMMNGAASLPTNALQMPREVSLDITSSLSLEDGIELGNGVQVTDPTINDLPSRQSTSGSEKVSDRMPAILMAPPHLSPQEKEKYEIGEMEDASAHQEMPESETKSTSKIRSGTIVFTWNNTNKKKVPYWIVPDGLEDDPYLVEKVLEAMKLPAPNLILRFSRLKQPVHEWRSGWNFDFTNDGFVEESALPRPLPPGMSRATGAVQKYMASVAKDRVLDILRSVSSACNQAGAWLSISDFEPGDEPLGFYDHVAPLVGQAAQNLKETVIFTTYSMEDRRTHPGGEAFCKALDKNAGVEGHEFAKMRPKPFTEDVTAEMKAMGLIDKSLDEEAKAAAKKATGRRGRGSLFDIEVEHFFRDRVYLPAKDLSHLLVFESKATEMVFKQQLNDRTPKGNFIMQGNLAAMNMFATSMKSGAPVFVLNGTGGAADRIALLIQHMKWRKRIQELGGDKKEEAEKKDGWTEPGCFPWSVRSRAKVEAEPEEAKLKDFEHENIENISIRRLVNGLKGKLEQVQGDCAAQEEAGDLARVMVLKQFQTVLRQCYHDAQEIESKMLAFIQKDGGDEAEQQALDEQYAQLKARVLPAIHNKLARAGKHASGEKEPADADKAKERSRNLAVLLPTSLDPPSFYNQQVRRGKEGLAWEKKVGLKYEEWLELPEEEKGDADDTLPSDWPVLWIGSVQCKLGLEDGVPVMCKQQSCAKCFAAQTARRKFLRNVATWGKEWPELATSVRTDYIRQWVANNPLDDDPSMVALCGQDKMAELSRVIFSNVWEPPVPDALVVVQTLDVELSVEEVMDKVTLAMSTDALVSEVGERRAYRERMLEAWKMVRMLKYNAGIQNRTTHVFNLLTILFTFSSVVVGTLTYQVSTVLNQAEAAGTAPAYAGFEWVDFQDAYDTMMPINVALPLAAGFLLALNSKFSPQNKYSSLITAMYTVESEIYKYRAKVGEYSAQGGLLQTANEGAEDGKKPQKKKNARTVFATRLDYTWSELGSSELKQQSLLQPKNIGHLMPLDRAIEVQQHPSLFEEGKVLKSGNSKLVRDTIERYSRVIEDDGIRTISAQDYLDIRVSEFRTKYQRRAPKLSRLLNFLQLLIFTATTLSTALGAFNYSQWIPVAMAFGAAIGSIVAYTQLEARLQRVNTALVAMSKLYIWWQRLSVIEQRIPHNKTFLVETAEAIIQGEAGCNLVSSQIEEENAEEEGKEDKGGK